MKKIKSFLMAVCIAILVSFAGCVQETVMMTGKFTTMDVPARVNVMPVTADLDVSEQKVVGRASGSVAERELLIQEATMKALGQDPPNPNGADILVGIEIFTEQTTMDDMNVFVAGYPARYANFRTVRGAGEQGDSVWLIIPAVGAAEASAGTGVRPGGLFGGMFRGAGDDGDGTVAKQAVLVSPVPKVRSGRAYITPRWSMLDAITGYGWWAFDIEAGYIWKRGFVLGGEFGLGFSDDEDDWGNGYRDEHRNTAGITLNIGRDYELANGLSATVGGSVGIWFREEYKDEYSYNYNSGNSYYEESDDERLGFFGPFINFRIYNFECAYKLFIGDGLINRMTLGYRIKI